MESRKIHNGRGGIRWEHENLPTVGSTLKNSKGELHTFDGLGVAGMLLLTGPDGIQNAWMPHDLEHDGFIVT